MTGSCGPGSETRGLKRIEKVREIGDIIGQSGGNGLNCKGEGGSMKQNLTAGGGYLPLAKTFSLAPGPILT